MITAQVHLTANEKAFLKICRNYNTADQQRGDNYSNGGINEAMTLFVEHADKKTKRQAAGGLIASLSQKGLGSIDTESDQFNLTEAGIVAAFDE